MNSIERVKRQLARQKVDHIAVYEHFWDETFARWRSEGHLPPEGSTEDVFKFDFLDSWPLNLTIDHKMKNEIVAEDEDTQTIRSGNGAILRYHKRNSTTPEHIGFDVNVREDWDARKDKLFADDSRINFEAYRSARKLAAERERFFIWKGLAVFESMHPVCGHENMLMAMALDPEWIHDMVKVYTDITIEMCETLFAKEGKPDGAWLYEDMGFKARPFMSPDMYREFLYPSHKRMIDYFHSIGCPVIMHSCGFIEPLIPHLVEAGLDCLQVIEVKAGMDLIRIYKNFGDRLSLMGGIDARCLVNNDRVEIERELRSKIPIVMQNNGFILHSDHGVPPETDFETFEFYKELGVKIGTY